MLWTVKLFSAFLLLGLCLNACSKSPSSTGPGFSNDFQKSDPQISQMVEAVRQTGGKSSDGNLNSRVCSLAMGHLDDMVSEGEISHNGFSERSQKMSQWGGTGSGEIVASNCSSGLSLSRGATACAKSWVSSPGHWSQMKKYWDNYCYAVKLAGNCAYCIGLFTNGDLSP